jgi:hypothetical protein
MPSESAKFDLIELRGALERQYGIAPSYSQIWLACANGKLPARREGRGWRVNRADLPLVAEHFGLTTSAPTNAA